MERINTKVKMEELTLKKYQEQAMTTCTESSRNAAYMLFNLRGEVDELTVKFRIDEWATAESFRSYMEKVKYDSGKIAKAIRKEEIPVPYLPKYTEEEKKAIKYEVGDVLWQLFSLCTVMDWDIEEIALMNLDKLQSRQQRNVIVGDGDSR